MFTTTRQQLAVMFQVSTTVHEKRLKHSLSIQEYPGALNFTTDAWTSPNHKPYVAFTVYFKREGQVTSMLLDILELSKRHTGHNLAEVFNQVLHDFGIENKVSQVFLFRKM